MRLGGATTRARRRGGARMALKHQAPRGTRAPAARRARALAVGRGARPRVFARYGYGEIRTPVFEDYELFARTSGESSEVVQKEMYRFGTPKGGHDYALRPENTAGVARAYLEHGHERAGTHPPRSGTVGPMFRYGTAAEGPLSPVPSDRRRDHRHWRRPPPTSR